MLKKLLLLQVLAITAIAQDSLSVDLSEIQVTGNISPADLKLTARNVSIITARQIAEMPVKTIQGILQFALNVDVRSRSPLGVQADVSIRGGHFDQTLIMIDGIKINDPQTGHHSMNLPLPLDRIERVEILQGGASRVYGPSAFSGIINFITKKDSESGVSLGGSVGQFGLYEYTANTDVAKGDIHGSINYSSMHSDGYAYNTAFDRQGLYGQLSKEDNRGLWNLQGGYTNQNFGASNFYHPAFFDQYEETAAAFLALTREHYFSNKLTAVGNLSYRRHSDLYDFNNYRDTAITKVNFHLTDVVAADWKMRYTSSLGITAVGFEFRNEHIWSNRLGDLTENTKAIKTHTAVVYDHQKNRSNSSVYLEQQKRLGNFLISGGTLLNQNSQFGWELYPGLDVSFNFQENTTFYTSINRSLRYPTFTELYLNTSTVRADPNLKPEKALNYELGYKWIAQKYGISSSVFYKQTRDAIDKLKRPELSVPTMENIDNINMMGLEVSGYWMPANDNGLLQRINLNYAYLLADRKEEGFQSFYTLNYLKHKLDGGIWLKINKNWTTQISYALKKREGAYQANAETAPINYKTVHLASMRLNYAVSKWSAYVDISNLLNQKYYDFGFVEQPGRWVSAGVKVRI